MKGMATWRVSPSASGGLKLRNWLCNETQEESASAAEELHAQSYTVNEVAGRLAAMVGARALSET